LTGSPSSQRQAALNSGRSFSFFRRLGAVVSHPGNRCRREPAEQGLSIPIGEGIDDGAETGTEPASSTTRLLPENAN